MSGLQDDGSASPPLDGFFYQADVSAWIALDLLVAKRIASRITLEPAGQEDLEADLADPAQASAAAATQLGTYRLIVQAKLRNTGPWDLTALKSLAHHGKRRKSARQRLEDDTSARYLLVTSAALQGAALCVGVSQVGAWPSASQPLPPTLALPGAKGRFAVLAGEDDFKVQRRLRELLEDAFRVPHVNLARIKGELQAETLGRMRRGADWTRDDLEALIRKHGGSIASAPEVERFVAPGDWAEALKTLDEHHAIVLTGESGTGKTLAAAVLARRARDLAPGAEVIDVTSPRQVAAHQGGSIIFAIEDPWGKYQIHPDAETWTHELPRMLRAAHANRQFIVTSRTDILHSTGGAEGLQTRWNFKLEAQSYGAVERDRIYDGLVRGLPRRLHKLAYTGRGDALEALATPLELEGFFAELAGGPADGEPDHACIRRCIDRASKDGLEAAVAAQVRTHGALAEAAILWGLLEARPKLSREGLPRIADSLALADPALADRLERWVNIQVASRNLRQTGEVLAYLHNRVEKGVRQALTGSRAQVRATLAKLATALIALDADGGPPWGRETAAQLLAAAGRAGFPVSLPAADQATLDAWLADACAHAGRNELSDRLHLAAGIASPGHPVREIAAFLMRRGKGFGGLLSWEDPNHPDSWYEALAADPVTAGICEAFVRHGLPYEQMNYPEAIAEHLLRLAPTAAPAFVAAACDIVSYGHLWNAEVVAHGALRDLDAFEPALSEAVAFDQQLAAAQPDPKEWLAFANDEYSEDYAEHLASSNDEGFTATVLIEAYVDARRTCDGWAALAGHRHASDLLWAWISSARDEPLQPGELEGLAAAAEGHRHEGRFWALATKRWDQALAPRLVARLVAGGPDDEARVAAAVCLATAAPHLMPDVLAGLQASGEPRRPLELIVDLSSALRDAEDVACRSVAETLLQAYPPGARDAARAILADAPATEAGAAHLRTVDPRPNRAFALGRARVLAAAGDDVSDILREELAHEDCDYGRIPLAEAAMDLAIARGLWPVVEEGVAHRLAVIRLRALEALAARTQGDLPPSLLALVADRGSGVRRRLVAILGERPSPAHTQALVTLAADRWEGSGSGYEHDSIYPIARAAVTALAAAHPPMPDEAHALADVARQTDDPTLRRSVFTLLATHAGLAGQDEVLQLTLENGRGYHGDAADALVFSPLELDPSRAAAIKLVHVTRRPGRIAASIALLLGRFAPSARLAEAADQLAADRDRRALIIPLMIGAVLAERMDAEAMADRLPDGIAAAAAAALEGGEKLEPETLHDLCSEPILQGLVAALPYLFRDSRGAGTAAAPATGAE